MAKTKLSKFIRKNVHWIIVGVVALVCALFITLGHPSENGEYITLNGNDAQISDTTKEFIEESKDALNRIMNEDKPTDESVEAENDEEATGQGFYTTIEEVLGRQLADGNNDNGHGWQCSRYTGWLGTGKWSYSSSHPDYGPVNGKDVASWLVKNYGYKYIDNPIKGAIGSGGFNTLYGHTAMYLYSTGSNTAMVNDANYVPLTVSTHSMNIDGWVWVVPGSYNPAPEKPVSEPAKTPEKPADPTPEPTSTVDNCKTRQVVPGDTMGKIMLDCTGKIEWGAAMNDYANHWFSTKAKPGQSVFYGWSHGIGYGLFYGDVIEWREQ